nr:uncharacterized protein LOC111504906 [Leptinotarsa decemlineata]
MVCRIHIFGSIVVIFVLQSTVVSEGKTNSTGEIASKNGTLPQISENSPNTEVPSIFPSSGIGNKPTISLNKTVDKPNLSAIRRNKLNEKPVIHDNTTEYIKVDSHETIETNSEVPSAKKLKKQIDTEIEDLLEVPKETYILEEPESPKVNHGPDQDVNLSVLLIDKFLLTEDSLRNNSYQNKLENVGIIQGKLAAILAGVFLVVSILGYITLLSWRRFLEHRYGNREMLVNEEDFYTGDLGHFSI